MKTKLILTIEDEVISTAKEYAKMKGKSLSHLVENYLKLISVQDATNLILSSRVSKLKGIIKLPANFDYKDKLSNALSKKNKK